MTLSPATPELPVRDLSVALDRYCTTMGFEMAWHRPDDGIGAVSHGDCAIFLRQVTLRPEPVTVWVFCTDVSSTYAAMRRQGAEITEPLADQPWGLRQFTMRDADRHRLILFHDP